MKLKEILNNILNEDINSKAKKFPNVPKEYIDKIKASFKELNYHDENDKTIVFLLQKYSQLKTLSIEQLKNFLQKKEKNPSLKFKDIMDDVINYNEEFKLDIKDLEINTKDSFQIDINPIKDKLNYTYEIYAPFTAQASCNLAQDKTTWCTAIMNNNGKVGDDNAFNKYFIEDNLYSYNILNLEQIKKLKSKSKSEHYDDRFTLMLHEDGKIKEFKTPQNNEVYNAPYLSNEIKNDLKIIQKYIINNVHSTIKIKLDKKKEEFKKILAKSFIEKLTRNSDGTYSTDGNVYIKDYLVSNGKLKIKFKYVGGGFYCRWNKLTTLEGCPEYVGGSFNCSENKLTTLKGGPQEVGGYFDCRENKLTSLEGAPQKVGGHFICIKNKLTSLKGGPQEVGGDFSCSKNKLTSLEGCPQKVGGYFNCSNNNLSDEEKERFRKEYSNKIKGNIYF